MRSSKRERDGGQEQVARPSRARGPRLRGLLELRSFRVMAAVGALIVLTALLRARGILNEFARTGAAVRPATAAEVGDPAYASRSVVAEPRQDASALPRLRALAIRLLWCAVWGAVGTAVLVCAWWGRLRRKTPQLALAPAHREKAGGDHVG